MTRAQATKWVNSLREKDGYTCMLFASEEFPSRVINTIKVNAKDLSCDEIADVIQAVYILGVLE